MSLARNASTALQGFLPIDPGSGESRGTPSGARAESGERMIEGREREAFDVLVPGTLVAGKYRVLGELGRGGFAVVYDAEHTELRRSVAIKVLHRTEGTPAVLIERFSREVRISALVRHPHVLEVFDAGALEDGSPFLVMEKITGETLHQYLCRAQKLAIGDALELSRQLLSALVALAERGIVHRDIKPENLMLTRDEAGGLQLKLVDFGIALLRSERAQALRNSFEPRLTMQGALIGTPHYMAPEQLRSELVDARVDIYATGVVMYQALTGCMPFDGADLSSLTLNVLHGTAQNLRELRHDCPPRLTRIIDRALARDPERRFASAAHMLAALEDCVGQQASVVRSQRYLQPLMKPLLARGKRLALAAAVLSGWLLWNQAGPLPAGFATTASVAGRASSLSSRERGRASTPAVEPMLRSGVPAATSGADDAAELTLTQLAPEAVVEPLPALTVADGSPGSARAARVETIDKQKATELSRKALALYLHGDLPAAYSAYRRATRANPDEPAAFRGVGLSASRLGKPREARRAFHRYLELAPRAADAELVRTRLAALDKP